MTVGDVLDIITAPDRVIIKQGDKELFIGYVGMLLHTDQVCGLRALEVDKLRFTLDIKHKQWKERGLMPPITPEEAPDYSFSDLQTTHYFIIHAKEGTENAAG